MYVYPPTWAKEKRIRRSSSPFDRNQITSTRGSGCCTSRETHCPAPRRTILHSRTFSSQCYKRTSFLSDFHISPEHCGFVKDVTNIPSSSRSVRIHSGTQYYDSLPPPWTIKNERRSISMPLLLVRQLSIRTNAIQVVGSSYPTTSIKTITPPVTSSKSTETRMETTMRAAPGIEQGYNKTCRIIRSISLEHCWYCSNTEHEAKKICITCCRVWRRIRRWLKKWEIIILVVLDCRLT